jgi:starch synthase
MSIYDDDFSETLDNNFASKIRYEDITIKDLKHYKKPNFVSMMKAGVDFSDGVIIGSSNINPEIAEYLDEAGKPVLPYQSPENYIDTYNQFYESILQVK